MLQNLVLGSLLATVSSAHFVLNWPPTAGFIDDEQGTAPCGGATVTVNGSAPEIQVDRFAVQVQSSHPQGQWEFRGTLSTEEPYNFTTIAPIVNTMGVGAFCLDSLSAPSEWAGQQGIVQVINVAVDGSLYQCAPVTFVSGSNDTLGSSCTNNTGFSATWSSEQSLNTSETTGMTMTSSASGTASATGDSSSSTSAGAAAVVTLGVGSLVGGIGLMAAGLL